MKKQTAHPQAMVEFLLITVVSVLIVYSLVYFMQFYSQYAWRVLALIAIDAP